MAPRINVVAKNLTVNLNGHIPSSIANRISSSSSSAFSQSQASRHLALGNSTRSTTAASVASSRPQPTYSNYSTYSTRTGASTRVPERVEIKPRSLTDHYPDSIIAGSSIAPNSSISRRGSEFSSASHYAPPSSQMELYAPTGAESSFGSVHTVRTGYTARTGAGTARSNFNNSSSYAGSRAGGSHVSTTSRKSRASRTANDAMALMRMGTVPEADVDSDEELIMVRGKGQMEISERCWDGDRGWEMKQVFTT